MVIVGRIISNDVIRHRIAISYCGSVPQSISRASMAFAKSRCVHISVQRRANDRRRQVVDRLRCHSARFKIPRTITLVHCCSGHACCVKAPATALMAHDDIVRGRSSPFVRSQYRIRNSEGRVAPLNRLRFCLSFSVCLLWLWLWFQQR